jgi:hypothetical protein
MADGERASEFYLREIELLRRLGDRVGEAWALYSLAFTEMYWGASVDHRFSFEHLAAAREHIEQAIAIYRDIGDEIGAARALWAQANVLWSLGPPVDSEDFATGRRHLSEALATFRAANDTFSTAWATYTNALFDVRSGNDDAGREQLASALRVFRDAGDVSGYVLILDALAFLALRAGDGERAARLSGAVATLEQRTGTGLNPPNRAVLGFDPEPLRTDPATAPAWEDGRRMSSDEAIAYALQEAVVDASD